MANKMQRFASQPTYDGHWEVAVFDETTQNYISLNENQKLTEEQAIEMARELNLEAEQNEAMHKQDVCKNHLISILFVVFLTLSMLSCTSSNSNPAVIPTDYCEELVKLAEEGNPKAQVNLALCYANAKGIEQNVSEYIKWLNKAVEQNDAEAMYWLSLAYNKGTGVEQSDAESIKWLRRSAELGWVQSQYELGGCYRGGLGVQSDIEESIKWYTMAAENGHSEAQYNLGEMYGMSGDEVSAFNWFKKSADQNDPKGQLLLGVAYYYGRGTAQNQELGLELIRKSANQGLDLAKEWLNNNNLSY